ncbi:hypothetical protein B0H14DRAFT_2921167 [Mycena olivaceomarginata]|nr:hypothetical protein B0H14DRAFT_2921167 [Mycena olivaceomarginata]
MIYSIELLISTGKPHQHRSSAIGKTQVLGHWARGLEHRITFSLDNQKIVNFLIIAIANTFGTVYTAALVSVTQRLWTRRNLQADRTLTAMHDGAAAWTGIGSALSQLWSQRTTSGSVVGVVSVFLYLANILVLHITTPALFAFETFNATWRVHVNWTNPDNAMYVFSQSSYVAGSLMVHCTIGRRQFWGGNVTVDATGFNITCNYLRAVTINGSTGVAIHNISAGWNSNGHTVKLDGVPAYNLFPTRKMGIICPLPDERFTIPIMDSDNYLPRSDSQSAYGYLGRPRFFHPNLSVLTVLVNQKAVVDAQTGQILSVEPNIHKTTSTWSPQIGQNSTNATDNVFMQAWHWLYNYAIPESTFAVDPRGNSGLLSVADLYLNQKLTLQRAGETVPRTVKLHDLENALSSIIASMYWTRIGNIPPQAILVNTDNGTIQLGTSDADSDAPILHRGSAEVTEVSTQGRLDSDIIAVSAALRTVVHNAHMNFRPQVALRHLSSFSPLATIFPPSKSTNIEPTTQSMERAFCRRYGSTQSPGARNPAGPGRQSDGGESSEAGMVRTRLVGAGRRSRESSELL